MSELSYNPQDPYASYVVAASAGCGKTYQLSRRFLYLVGAGANPESILTITFTRKAAQEMRERILSDAASLWSDRGWAEEFEETVAGFHEAAKAENADPHRLRPPRSAYEVADLVLTASQLLKITTIDSIFMEWLRKFPFEASLTGGEDRKVLPPQFDVMAPWDSQLLSEKAMLDVVPKHISENQTEGLGLSVTDVEFQVGSLEARRSFVWLLERGLGQDVFRPHGEMEVPDEEDLWQLLETEMAAILNILPAASGEKCQRAYATRNLDEMRAAGLFTKEYTISGRYLRGKKRDAVAPEVAAVEEAVQHLVNARSLKRLNQVGSYLMKIYTDYARLRDELKLDKGQIEFEDMGKGCFRLFHDKEAVGARFLIHRHVTHLMLDEFQDTSLMQWTIFLQLIGEMLAGEGLSQEEALKPSLFLVGDTKQSIYGFREADPAIMEGAGVDLRSLGVGLAPLNKSFRTSQVILDYVNHVFTGLWSEFPRHETAAFGEISVVPAIGSVTVGPVFGGGEDGLEPLEAEARYVARFIKRALGHDDYTVYDKDTKCLRPLRAGDCAVLYRTGTGAALYEAALRAEGVEVRRAEGGGFFRRVEVSDMLALLRFLALPMDYHSLGVVLKSPLCRIPDGVVLAALRGKNPDPWALLADYPKVQALRNLLAAAGKASPCQLFWQALVTMNGFHCYHEAFQGVEGRLAVLNLIKFGEMLQEMQQSGRGTLVAVIQQMELMAKVDETSLAAEAQDAVTLMTVHKSKGLEYSLVALVGTAEAWHKKDHYWAKSEAEASGLGLHYMGRKGDQPIGLSRFDRIYEAIDEEAAKEDERLLYVALTRARHHLLITGNHKNQDTQVGFYPTIKEALEKQGGKEVSICEEEVWSYGVTCPPDAPEIGVDEVEGWEPSDVPAAAIDAASQVYTLAPHRTLTAPELEDVEEAEDKKPLAQERGLLIHRGLEAAIKGQSVDLEDYWRSMVASDEFDEIRDEAIGEVESTLDSKDFQSLLAGFDYVEAEMEVVAQMGHQMIRGTIDLYLKGGEPMRTAVVDFKTTQSVNREWTHMELLQYAKAKGYQRQLHLYGYSVAQLEGVNQVAQGVFFTNIGRLMWF